MPKTEGLTAAQKIIYSRIAFKGWFEADEVSLICKVSQLDKMTEKGYFERRQFSNPKNRKSYLLRKTKYRKVKKAVAE